MWFCCMVGLSWTFMNYLSWDVNQPAINQSCMVKFILTCMIFCKLHQYIFFCYRLLVSEIISQLPLRHYVQVNCLYQIDNYIKVHLDISFDVVVSDNNVLYLRYNFSQNECNIWMDTNVRQKHKYFKQYNVFHRSKKKHGYLIYFSSL